MFLYIRSIDTGVRQGWCLRPSSDTTIWSPQAEAMEVSPYAVNNVAYETLGGRIQGNNAVFIV